jgi:hypothetical protein
MHTTVFSEQTTNLKEIADDKVTKCVGKEINKVKKVQQENATQAI